MKYAIGTYYDRRKEIPPKINGETQTLIISHITRINFQSNGGNNNE
jgi:hypothetical protein